MGSFRTDQKTPEWSWIRAMGKRRFKCSSGVSDRIENGIPFGLGAWEIARQIIDRILLRISIQDLKAPLMEQTRRHRIRTNKRRGNNQKEAHIRSSLAQWRIQLCMPMPEKNSSDAVPSPASLVSYPNDLIHGNRCITLLGFLHL